MQDARRVAEALEEIAAYLALSGQGRFKAQAYDRGAQVVRGLGGQLGPLLEAGRLTEIEGIGTSLARHITELWTSGRSSLLEQLQSQQLPGTLELSKVAGLSPRRRTLVQTALGVSSVEELRAACLAQRVRALPGFGVKTEQRILEGIEQLARPQAPTGRMLLSDALALHRRFEHPLSLGQGIEGLELAGAARRGEETVAELEFVVLGAPEAGKRWLSSSAALRDVDLEQGSARLVESGLPLVVRFAEGPGRGVTLVRATSTDEHWRSLQAAAQGRALELREDGLFARGALLDLSSEAAVYQALGLGYVPPELRDGPFHAFEAELPLVTLAELRGMVHCHTTYSDGRNSIEEMARAAEALGMEYITITDHSPTAHYARGVELDRLAAQWEEIARVQERVRIRILRGTESDILPDGSLDYPDAVLEQFDVVIASIHARHRMNRAEMTARLVRAMELPVPKIWGHALGRLLLSREPIDCDVEAIFDALARSRGGAIELNGDPHRLDLPPALISLARERGLPFVLSVDAHSAGGLSVLPLAVTMARRGRLGPTEVLNTRSADDFLRALHGDAPAARPAPASLA